jgi:hypothetical protein
MSAKAEAQELRDLLILAKKLRDFAAQTDDGHYIGLFLATAQGLEERAEQLALVGTAPSASSQSAGMARRH